ncbi:hypothetical protein SDC9_44039 [bioreactor metagenome]|uniref:Uncharacterized protein n=1 Tax=bioreactor metagenome TaxID=1076179 RepID=A0A644W292_9ZZZZ
MLYLNISSQNAKLQYNIKDPVLNLQTTKPQLQINTEPAKLDIHQAKGQLEIDNTAYRYSIGIKTMQDMARDNARAGRQTALEAIGRIAREGDRMAAIENKENVFANMAAENNIQQPPEITWAPIAAPRLHYNFNPAQINITPGTLDINLQRGDVAANLDRGTVDFRIAQYQSLKFWTTENKYDTRV